MMTYSKVPVFENGAAQPVFPFTPALPVENYDPNTSEILRFCVYVETDYDLDGDGRRDRVKVFVQVPKSAAEGNYKAAALFEGCPYIPGVNVDVFEHLKEVQDTTYPKQDLSIIKETPAGVPTGCMSSLEAACLSDSSEWYYKDPGFERGTCFDLECYRYYLVRGFAVLECGGFGTLGSDGVVFTGSDYETHAFQAVVEWVHGDRIAYVDRRGTVEIKADWANGCTAMTGKSYAGTLPFAVAVTGTPGLKTIVPLAGIADCYSLLNQQGAQRYYPQEMLQSMLAYFCTSRYHDPSLTDEQKEFIDAFLHNFSMNQVPTGFDYGPYWEEANYAAKADGIRCSALIVHGLNDDNVPTIQADRMFKSFKKASQNVKLMLHQGGHSLLTSEKRGMGLRVGDGFYDDIINQWISHYLYDIENGAENMPELLVQSNLKQDHWDQVTSWETGRELILRCEAEGTTLVDTDWDAAGINKETFNEKMSLGSTNMNRRYLTKPLTEDLTIQGITKVSFQAALQAGDAAEQFYAKNVGDADKKTLKLWYESGRQDDLKLTIHLVDIAEEAFDSIAAVNGGRDDIPTKLSEEKALPLGGDLENLDVHRFETVSEKYKIISRSYIDLCNPASGYEPESCATSIEMTPGEYHDYTLYMNPNRYTVAAGHRLAVVIGTEDPENCLLHKEYTAAILNASVTAKIPVWREDGKALWPLSILPE